MIGRAVLSYLVLVAWLVLPALVAAAGLAVWDRRQARRQARYRARVRLELTRQGRRVS